MDITDMLSWPRWAAAIGGGAHDGRSWPWRWRARAG